MPGGAAKSKLFRMNLPAFGEMRPERDKWRTNQKLWNANTTISPSCIRKGAAAVAPFSLGDSLLGCGRGCRWLVARFVSQQMINKPPTVRPSYMEILAHFGKG